MNVSKIIEFINTNFKDSSSEEEIFNNLQMLNKYFIDNNFSIDINKIIFILNNCKLLEKTLKNLLGNETKIDDQSINIISLSGIIREFVEIYCAINAIVIEDKKAIEFNGELSILNIYTNDIRNKSRLLTNSEEKILFMRIKDGDKEAKKIVIESNLFLVIYIANMFIGQGLDILDLIQEGNLGLINAVDNYDYTLGNKFSTYAVKSIKRTLERSVYNYGRTIRLPVHLFDTKEKLEKVISSFGYEPTYEEIGKKMHLKPKKVMELMQIFMNVVSINEKIDEEDNKSNEFGNILHTDTCIQKDYEEKVIRQESIDTLIEIFNCLSPLEQKILVLRYGLNDGIVRTGTEVGKILNCSKQNISQIEIRALNKIKIRIQYLYPKLFKLIK